MNVYDMVEQLRFEHRHSLILNPTESIPWRSGIDTEFLEGMYLPEKERTPSDKIIFAGRPALNSNERSLYESWIELIGSKNFSMKFHSGLDAHIILFMSIADIGDEILLLPEEAGGHFSTRAILERLGLKVSEIPVLIDEHKVDISATKKIIEQNKPRFIFIDRSEGLDYEDFSWVKKYHEICKVFDASQYLSHIIANHYDSPFEMGFDIVISTLHKNYPGFQKAAVFTLKPSPYWERIEYGLNTFISNIHPKDIIDTLLATPTRQEIIEYSQKVLDNAENLYEALRWHELPIVKRNHEWPHTQHIWIQAPNRAKAYQFFLDLEKSHILTNYRLLPYNLGYGIRIGTAAATIQGLNENHIECLAQIMSDLWYEGELTDSLAEKAAELIRKVVAT